jgi:N-acetylglucosaminyl-diphospho-decaprenol L-rhamnosyltransferase
MPELDVVIVNRNGQAFLPRCLDSLRGRARAGRVIVVDNASTDGSAELVARDFPEVELVRAGDNLGFARANNLALARSRAPYVLLLNPDTVVLEGALDILLETLEGDPRAGACGPRLVREDGSFQVSFGGRVSFFREAIQKTLLNPYYAIRLGSMRRPRRVGWVSGACLLARRAALDEAGGFDEKFFLYFEDIDLCRRLTRRGWKVLFVPRARVFHLGGAATRVFSPSRYEYRRSQLLFYGKHASPLSRRLLRTFLRLSFLFRRLTRGRKSGGPRFEDLLRGPGGRP